MRVRTNEAITPPVLGETVWALDADAFNAASWIAVPAAWENAVLEFHADGEAFAFGFGTSAVSTVAATTNSTVSSNAITAVGACAYVLANGARVKVDMSRIAAAKKARLAVLGITGTANNKLRITLCDRDIT